MPHIKNIFIISKDMTLVWPTIENIIAKAISPSYNSDDYF
jgi:hypothetical protein